MGIITGLVMFVASLSLFVGVDVHVHEKDFAASLTGRGLKEIGGYEIGLMAYEQAAIAGIRTTGWAKKNVPVYLNATSEYLNPYIRLGRDVSLVVFNLSKQSFNKAYVFVQDNYPIAEYWYVYYFGFCMLPGPISSVVQAVSIITHLDSVFSAMKVQKNLPIVRDSLYNALDIVKGYSVSAVGILQKNVFSGNLSPENIQKYAKEAYNYTEGLATGTMSWVYEKVQNLSK